MQLCAITDRKALAPAGESEAVLRQKLRSLVHDWIDGGVDFIQLREKDLSAYRLASLAEEILAGVDRRQSKLLINLPASLAWIKALAPFADGVHIPGHPKPGAAALVRQIYDGLGRDAVVSMACHSVEHAQVARTEGADLALFAPVFEKPFPRVDVPGEAAAFVATGPLAAPGQGLAALHSACEAAGTVPVFALGGVTASNASECIAAGAAGVAGIRLFAGDSWRKLKPGPVLSEGARPIYS